MDRYDAIVIGGGHNGLVNGAYLARGGLKTLILEQRHLVGGAAITEELHPGFWFTTFSYALSLLRPQIIHELELTKHGFMPILMSSKFAPTPDGDYLWFTQDHDANLREIARISPHDADAYEQYGHDMDRVCQALKPLLDMVPPDPFSDDPEELLALAGARLALPCARQADVPQRDSAHDREHRGLPRRLLRIGPAQGVDRLVGDHRLQGRPAIRRLGPGPPVPLPRRARRVLRLLGVPQGRQRRLHPGPGTSRRGVRRRDPAGGAGGAGAHARRRGDRRGAGGRDRDRGQRRGQRARPATHVHRAGRPARASGRPGRATSAA